MEVDVGIFDPVLVLQSQYKRRRISLDSADNLSCQVLLDIEDSLPILQSSDYYTEPCLSELSAREFMNPGFCSRVQDFIVGRVGYGCVKFIGETDVRWLNLDQIIKFNRGEIVLYEDESSKPVVGQGLNKPAEVTLFLRVKSLNPCNEDWLKEVVGKLKHKTESQGAKLISFDPINSEWKFSVPHFSKFGLSEDDEEDIIMNDVSPEAQDPAEMIDGEVSDIDNETSSVDPTLLSHSLPAHLGLDPVKMREMRMLMFPAEEEDLEDFNAMHSHEQPPSAKEYLRSPLHHSSQRLARKTSPPVIRKTPLALIEYNPGSYSSSSPGSILMVQQNKGLYLKPSKSDGFKLDLKHETPVSGSHSHNIVDAALFMGRSFRVGWGPNGVLVHCGRPVGSTDHQNVLSSVINLEKVAIDKVTRDENNKVKEELSDFCFDSPLNLHKELTHETKEVELGSFKLKLQKLVCNRMILSEICRSYIAIIERQLEVPGLSSALRVLLMHQVMVWELIKVLFSSRKISGNSNSVKADNEEDMMPDGTESAPQIDLEALPLTRRAEFSFWLQESVYHRIQEEVSSLNDFSDLEHIFLLLTGREMDAAVEIAASRGDVRLACLLSQAGGSIANRADVAHQLDLWRKNGMDFSFIEEERVRLLELLSGNIHGALHGVKIDWKRFLGLLMWYQLPPDTSLPDVFNTYQKLVNDGRAPNPVPVYIDECLTEEDTYNWETVERFDLAYYLMLLHARQENDFGALKTMFSAFASTNDPLDYHMIWHQCAVLEAIGTFSSNDLHVLDMGFVSQLLCLGKCHWAIYVVLHMPHREDYPYLQATVIREILFQYCEVWSTNVLQRQFIEKLGIPLAWLHEALAVYFNYNGDSIKALEHFLECSNWQKAHSIFISSVVHSMFLSGRHSEIWRLATSMEDHKSEIEDWDLGAGVYVSFYLLRSSLQEDSSTLTEMDTFENKNDACRDFIGSLNKSLAVWSTKLPVDARVAYSKMAEEICSLLLSDSSEGSSREAQLNCFDTMFRGPIPEDLRSCHLQDAVSVFTCYLLEEAQ
ncbi:nuclear pore complex protein NUP96 [Olea europaea var. sylvestris]|uniref:nuclear pore complex protein NUP96 n=1 Tax=Olea europaea var. sylvestris TaxID=158386 RepID=UPI000C1CFBA6|nr:nuclear pore complex protein NUP96 [Olea europaea var. sylvestris]